VDVRLRDETLKIPVNLGPFTANTRSATPQKDQAQAADKGKSKKIDMGKSKIIELKKPKKVVYPIQTGGAFKIHERKAPTPSASLIVPPTKNSLAMGKKKVEVPSRVARALKLANEEDELEAERPIEAVFEPTP
jgi:hypothetical protein